MFDQSVAGLSAGHLFHDAYKLLLHLAIAGWLCDPDGSHICHLGHVNHSGQNLMKELNAYNLRVLRWQKPLKPEHVLVKSVDVRKESVNGILKGH